jgi:hypothetical protein
MLQCLIERRPQFDPQIRIHDGEQIVRGLAANVTQEASDVFGHVQDFRAPVNQDARRREVFDHALMQRRKREACRPWQGPRDVSLGCVRCLRDRGQRGRYSRSVAGRFGAINTALLVDGSKQILSYFG